MNKMKKHVKQLRDKYGTPLREDVYVYLPRFAGQRQASLVYAKPNENGTITITQHCGVYGLVSCDIVGKSSKFLIPLAETRFRDDTIHGGNMRFMLSKLEKL